MAQPPTAWRLILSINVGLLVWSFLLVRGHVKTADPVLFGPYALLFGLGVHLLYSAKVYRSHRGSFSVLHDLVLVGEIILALVTFFFFVIVPSVSV